MRVLRTSSITTRLTAMNLLVCVSALIVACVGFLSYDVVSIRDSIVRTVSSQAEIIAQSSSSSVVFNDPDTAERSLLALRGSPNISGALIVTTQSKKPFAQYGSGVEIPVGLRTAEVSSLQYEFSSTYLVVAAPIKAGDATVGTLYVASDLKDLNQRLLRYLLIAATVLVLSILGGLLVSVTIRRSIADPIVGLARTADLVTREKNFSLRAESVKNVGELTVLVDSFNEMLSQIERRDRALRELAIESQVTLQSIPQLVFTANPAGTVLLLNDRWYRYTGMDPEEDKNNLSKFIHPEDREDTMDKWAKSVATGEPFGCAYRIRRSDGEYRWFFAQAIPIRDDQQSIQKWFGTLTDIHEQRLAQEALIRSEKLAATGRMAASVAHEINNPLAAITNVVHLLRQNLHHDSQEAELLNILHEEIQRVSHIVKSTLGLSRQNATVSSVKLSDLTEEVLVLFEKRLASRNITVEKRYDPAALEISVVPTEIRQAISNLIANAMDVSPFDSRILLSVHRATSSKRGGREGVRLSVADYGPGIPQQYRERLFEPFFSTKADLGNGLGLWISKGIVEKHGGTLRYRTHLGESSHGTVFSIFLPLVHSIGDETAKIARFGASQSQDA